MLTCLGFYSEFFDYMVKRKTLHDDEMPAVANNSLKIDELLNEIRTKKTSIVIGGKIHASEAQKALQIFKGHGIAEGPDCSVIDLTRTGNERSSTERSLFQQFCRTSLPLVFVKGDCIGNVADLEKLNMTGVLKEWLQPHAFDLVVVGGGSGGLAAAQEAADLGKKVAVLDYVVPTPTGTTWGLGGTCVNVGCIPKKLMHQAALLGHGLNDAKAFGWQINDNAPHSWDTMRDAVQAHIKSLNWGSKVALRVKNIKYLNSYGRFVGSHKIQAVSKSGETEELTSDRFLIATGLRPRYLDNCPGAKEYCVTSDDLFTLPYPPGKTLLVGASYVSLECAGFLYGVGFDVTVMVRSILLRGFDQDMAERIGAHMVENGIKFIREAIPTKIELVQERDAERGTPRLLRVTASGKDGEIVGEYNTVVLAIGRDAVTDSMGLDEIGVKRNTNKKLVCYKNEQSVSTPYIYAVGDVLDAGIELTPVAIQAGRLLMKRLFGSSTELCDYVNVPTAVFTPLEYGACGLSEENAIKEFGKESIEVFHSKFGPLEYTVPHRKDSDHCYAKLICNKKDDMRVLGLHILGPNAGEVTQGFSIGLKLNAKKTDFERLIGIHPTVAEVFTTLKVTKASNANPTGGQC